MENDKDIREKGTGAKRRAVGERPIVVTGASGDVHLRFSDEPDDKFDETGSVPDVHHNFEHGENGTLNMGITQVIIRDARGTLKAKIEISGFTEPDDCIVEVLYEEI
jgi:hypothetical protein